MAKQTLFHHVLVAGLSVLAIAAVTEGYLRARAFVVQVQESSRDIAVLKHEIATLQVMVDNAPQPTSGTLHAANAAPVPQPVPEPMVVVPLPVDAPRKLAQVAQVAPQHAPSPKAAAAAASDEADEDGPVVLLKAPAKSKAQPAPQGPGDGRPGLDVRLLSDRK